MTPQAGRPGAHRAARGGDVCPGHRASASPPRPRRSWTRCAGAGPERRARTSRVVETQYAGRADPSGQMVLERRFSDGEIQYLLQDWPTASVLFYDLLADKAFNANPKRPDALWYLADALYQQKSYGSARLYLKRAPRPRHPPLPGGALALPGRERQAQRLGGTSSRTSRGPAARTGSSRRTSPTPTASGSPAAPTSRPSSASSRPPRPSSRSPPRAAATGSRASTTSGCCGCRPRTTPERWRASPRSPRASPPTSGSCASSSSPTSPWPGSWSRPATSPRRWTSTRPSARTRPSSPRRSTRWPGPRCGPRTGRALATPPTSCSWSPPIHRSRPRRRSSRATCCSSSSATGRPPRRTTASSPPTPRCATRSTGCSRCRRTRSPTSTTCSRGTSARSTSTRSSRRWPSSGPAPRTTWPRRSGW